MPKYFNDQYNIITLGEYFNNILSYQYTSFIEIDDKNYFRKIQKDYFKDFYCAMIDNDVEPRWNENLLDKLVDFNSPYDYLILDSENLESYIKSYDIFTWLMLDFVYYLDMEKCGKFDFVNSLIRTENINHIVKLKRIPRNIKYFPINAEEIKHNFLFIEEYRYNGLEI
jgi:hypothetical protein